MGCDWRKPPLSLQEGRGEHPSQDAASCQLLVGLRGPPNDPKKQEPWPSACRRLNTRQGPWDSRALYFCRLTNLITMEYKAIKNVTFLYCTSWQGTK